MTNSIRAAALSVYKRLPVCLRRQLFRGDARYCPVCDSSVGRFVEAGVTALRCDARCPICGSEERQRLAWIYAFGTGGLAGESKKRVLHMAPSECVETRLSVMPHIDYVPADLDPKPGHRRADLTALPFEDKEFDLIWCSHVLEHIVDDRRAMREMLRVLVPGGHAVIQVPISAEVTIEDASVTDPAERLREYGQSDHVRRYGPDVLHRLREAGFTAQALGPGDLLSGDEQRRMAVPEDEAVYACVRPDGD